MQPGLPGAPKIMVMIILIIIKYKSIISNITSSLGFASYKLSINLFVSKPYFAMIRSKECVLGTVIDATEVASCGDIMDSDGVGPIVPGDHWTPTLASNYVGSGWGGGLLIVSNNTGPVVSGPPGSSVIGQPPPPPTKQIKMRLIISINPIISH